ncbi:replication initiation negative regulator SeqA [Thalassotalea ponticola]|uniref:replication initiation negative regulator SeqA n=1 Tax=Thalassotalea ponticola TaxID=1523392 RepID=UPI0025B39654|nr:replication initiation negative regulator SeqA [Thalassotalea ponticola]MDN3652242.1 replication initiation negative regulator SeqA [Thalassotalea ponticola]
MKTIEIDDELYQYIASNTKFIGESASDILRRLLKVSARATAETATANVDLSVDNTGSKPVDASTEQASATSSHLDALAIDSDEPASSDQTDESSDNNVVVTQPTEPTQNVFDLINKEELAMQRGAVGRFLLILSTLYRIQNQEFEQVLDIRGRDRLYFAKSEDELLEYGSSTKPKMIPNSSYWVITNSNTTKKKRMLTDVAIALGYSADDAERIRDLL